MAQKVKNVLGLAGLFGSFMLLQLCVLWLGNRAGEGWLSVERQELVYYAIQVFAILGFVGWGFLPRGARRGALAAALVLACAGTAALLLCAHGPFYAAATFLTVLCVSCLGGAVNTRMAAALTRGLPAAPGLGVGAAAAVLLQYVLQIRWTLTPLLAVLLLAALALMALALLRRPEEAPAPERTEAAPRRALVCVCLIAAALLGFTAFYNGYIHHLQIASGYGTYNVYSWPRLLLIPVYLLFGALGSAKRGRLVPLAALCVVAVALLNSVLAGDEGSYWLNMCLFYAAIAAEVSYYHLCFWRLAPGAKRPALFAVLGRVLDSAVVLLGGLLQVSSLSAPVVLAVDVVLLAAVLVLMAWKGDFAFAAPAVPAAAAVSAPPPPEADPVEVLRERCGLTEQEAAVFRELVLTEDKQEAVAARLGISVNTLRHHVTALYRKTGAQTRAGLTRMAREKT